MKQPEHVTIEVHRDGAGYAAKAVAHNPDFVVHTHGQDLEEVLRKVVETARVHQAQRDQW